jgi:hypothetical protein
MQPYCDPTRKTTSKKKWRRPQQKLKNKHDLKKERKKDDLKKIKWRQPKEKDDTKKINKYRHLYRPSAFAKLFSVIYTEAGWVWTRPVVCDNFAELILHFPNKGRLKKNLTDQNLFSLYLEFGWSDLQNFGLYPP